MAWTHSDTAAEAFFASHARKNAAVIQAMSDEPGTLPAFIKGATSTADKVAACIAAFDRVDETGKEMAGSFVQEIASPFNREHGNGSNAGYEVTLDMGPHEAPIVIRAFVVREFTDPHTVATVTRMHAGWQTHGQDIVEAIRNVIDMSGLDMERVPAAMLPATADATVLDIAA